MAQKRLFILLMLAIEALSSTSAETEIADARVQYALHSMPAETQLINVIAAKDSVFDQPVIQCPDPETLLQLFSRQSFRDTSQIQTQEVLLSVNCTMVPLTVAKDDFNYPSANFLFLKTSKVRNSKLREEKQKDFCIPVTEKGKTIYVFPGCECLCLAKPDLIISTNNKLLMETILSRLDAWWLKRVALPANLDEWKFVNQQAYYWGLRHFSAGDISSPNHSRNGNFVDSHAEGLIYEFMDNDHELQMTYLSNNLNRQMLAAKLIKDADVWTTRHVLVKSLGPSATRITISDSRCVTAAVRSVAEWFNPPWALMLDRSRYGRAL